MVLKAIGDMRVFLVIWVGQMISLLGTQMTRFALMIWAYQQTGDATTLALLGFFGFGPFVLISPFAGIWIDRLDRRLVMLFADLGAGLATVLLLILYSTGQLQIWHLYLLEGLTGALEAFQIPAYTAVTSVLVPRTQYGRAGGLRALATDIARTGGPLVAGLALLQFGLVGVMLIDIISFLFAVSILAFVRVPRPPVSLEGQQVQEGSLWVQLSFGFRYIFQRRGLLGLQIIYMGINLFAALTYFAILPAMILARSAGDELALASVQAALGIGGVAGGVLFSLWGGPRPRIHGILAGAAISFLVGDLLFALGQSLEVWVLAAFLSAFFIPCIIASDRTIWQVKVPPDIQGRVFAIEAMLREATIPIGYIAGGLLADHLFEPSMAVGGPLTEVFGGLVGVGPGAGMALMFGCTAILGMMTSLSGYLFRSVRRVEADLPDYESEEMPAQPLSEPFDVQTVSVTSLQ